MAVRNDTYILTEYYKVQTQDTKNIKYPNASRDILQNWVIKSNDENISGKKQNFNKSTETNSPTGDSRETSLPPIGNFFRYTETSSNNHGNKVLLSLEPTDFFSNW